MIELPSVFDGLLSLSLVLLAWFALHSKDLFLGIVLFVMFGILVAVAWLRLHAPDIALTEVALGAGLTGALFLGTLGRTEVVRRDRGQGLPGGRHLLTTVLVSGLGIVLCVITARLAAGGGGMGDLVRVRLEESGVENPVTAVILNFRGYDTLFEIGVLFLALLGAHALHQAAGASTESLRLPRDSMLVIFVHIMTPVLILTAAYLVWVGDHRPGGAFQAGAILGGAGVIILLAGVPVSLRVDHFRLRLVGVLGFAVFLVTGTCLMVNGRFLEYPVAHVKWLLLVVELACALSIGFILSSLFAACASLLHPSGERGGRRD